MTTPETIQFVTDKEKRKEGWEEKQEDGQERERESIHLANYWQTVKSDSERNR